VRNFILGGIGVLWGGSILLNTLIKLLSGSLLSVSNGYYVAGQMAAVAFGALLFGVGLYFLMKEWRGSYGNGSSGARH
jgi:hypothetical protein